MDGLARDLMPAPHSKGAQRGRARLVEAMALVRASFLTGEDNSARVARLVNEACEVMGRCGDAQRG